MAIEALRRGSLPGLPLRSADQGATWSVTALRFKLGCRIVYTKNSEWAGGFTGTVTINNTGTTTISG